mgnify:FL=1
MKASIFQHNLRDALSMAQYVARSNEIVVVAEPGRLKVSAKSKPQDVAISYFAEANVDQAGEIVVPSRLLSSLVAVLDKERVDLSVTKRTLNISCGHARAKILGLDPSDSPMLQMDYTGAEYLLDPKALRLAISQVVFAAFTGDSRPVLTGIHIDFQGDRLTLAGADGYRLAVHRLAASGPPASILLPAAYLSRLCRLVSRETESIRMRLSSDTSHAILHMCNAEMILKIIPGVYPNTAQLIPPGYTTRTIVGVKEFLPAVRRAAVFNKTSGIIRLHIVQSRMTISSRHEEEGEHEESIAAQVEGPEAKIAFNSRYLLDALRAMPGPQVALETTTPSSPGVFKPVGADNYVHVVMPMFVQWEQE